MTLHRCPRCNGPGVSGIAKRWSARENPATCRLCGCLSHVIASTSSGIGVVTFILLILGAIAAAGLQSWLVLVPAVCLAVAYNAWAWRRAELFPIPPESAQTARKVGWLVTGLGLLASIWS